jgi:hypothetical protein
MPLPPVLRVIATAIAIVMGLRIVIHLSWGKLPAAAKHLCEAVHTSIERTRMRETCPGQNENQPNSGFCRLQPGADIGRKDHSGAELL